MKRGNPLTMCFGGRGSPMRRSLLTSLLGFAISVILLVPAAANVARIHDGDTLTTTSGVKVRLLQIDTPEISPAECYGAEAREALIKLIGTSTITLEKDSVSDDKDRFGRSLRYVRLGKVNVNLKLVEIGAATPYFFNGEKGKYSAKLMKAAEFARKKKFGLWKNCPNTKLNPSKPAETGPVPQKSSGITKLKTTCDPNYDGCIPAYPPDLNCAEVRKLGLAPIRVVGLDVHKFDGDGDGIGCDK